MLIILNKDNKLHRPLNLTGVANPHITGATINLHTHDDTPWINHTPATPNARTTMTTMVVHADTNRLG